MSGATPPLNHHGRRLLRQLRELRDRTGFTQQEAGDRVRIEFKKLSRIESKQLPTYHELVALLAAYDVADQDFGPYIELWEQAKQRSWWREFGLRDDSGYLAAEEEACVMLEFQLGCVPELLQTADSARELQKHLALGSEQDMDTQLAVLERRQERLYAGNDRQLDAHFIVAELVLHQGGDRAQLLRLVECAKLPNVTLQVLPQSVRFHPGLGGSMVLFGFHELEESDQAFTSDAIYGFRPVRQGDTFLVGQSLKDLERLAMNARKTTEFLAGLVREG